MHKLGAVLLLTAAGSASAQMPEMLWAWTVEYSDPANVINSPDDTVTALLTAQFNDGIQFGAARFDIRSRGLGGDDNDDAGFTSGALVGIGNFDAGTAGNPALGELTNVDGTIAGDAIRGIEAFQLPFGVDANALDDNPIEVYRVTWRTDDLTQRQVLVETTNHVQSLVYMDQFGSNRTLQSTPDAFRIQVVPAPATAALLGMGGLLSGRRRRPSRF